MRINRSMTARSNGSHDAAAMIIGCTMLTVIKPLKVKAMAATMPPIRLMPMVRQNMYMKAPARSSWATVNQP